MKNISHKVRWWIALIADLLVLIPSGIQSGFWRAFNAINAWTYLFLIASLGLLALGVVWYVEYLNRRFSTLDTTIQEGLTKADKDLRDGLNTEGRARGAVHDTAMQMDELMEKRLIDKIKALEDKLPSTPVPQSLKNSTLSLRDELRSFIDNAPPTPEQRKDESRDDYLKRLLPSSSRRVDYLVYGYAWRFHDRVLVVNSQFGERGLLDAKLNEFANRPQKDDECYREILAGLTRLSEYPEQATGGK